MKYYSFHAPTKSSLLMYAQTIIVPYQAKFMPENSTTDQLFFRIFLERIREFGISNYHLFVDFMVHMKMIQERSSIREW